MFSELTPLLSCRPPPHVQSPSVSLFLDLSKKPKHHCLSRGGNLGTVAGVFPLGLPVESVSTSPPIPRSTGLEGLPLTEGHAPNPIFPAQDALISTRKSGLGLHGVTLTGAKERSIVLGYEGPEV